MGIGEMEVVALSVATIALVMVVCVANRPKQRTVNELPRPSIAVRALATSGEKIAAIRDYRKQSGASLFEATRVIEQYEG